MRREHKNMIRTFFIATFFITLSLLFGTGLAFSDVISDKGEVAGELCLTSKETAITLKLDIADNGFISGDFCVEGCGCGTILGQAHIADVDGTSYGTIDIYADLPEVCAYGIWYSIDMPSLSHLWSYTGLTSARYSGTGEFQEIACPAP